MGKMIQIRDVPEPVHRKLKSRAALAGLSLSDYLLREVEAISGRPTPAEIRDRLASRPGFRPRRSLAAEVRSERDAR